MNSDSELPRANRSRQPYRARSPRPLAKPDPASIDAKGVLAPRSTVVVVGTLVREQGFRLLAYQKHMRGFLHPPSGHGNGRQNISQGRNRSGSEVGALHPRSIQFNLARTVWETAPTNRMNPPIHLYGDNPPAQRSPSGVARLKGTDDFTHCPQAEVDSIVHQPDPCGVDSPRRGIRQLSRQDCVGLLQEGEPGAVDLPRPLRVSELLAHSAKLKPLDLMPLLVVAHRLPDPLAEHVHDQVACRHSPLSIEIQSVEHVTATVRLSDRQSSP